GPAAPGPTVSGPPAPGNGIGELTSAGDYALVVHGDEGPPAPWINVIANPLGGCVVTERGGGFTWAANSYLFRLTPWSNDPVSDPPGEVVYLTDEATRDSWSAAPSPRGREGRYDVRHSVGCSTFVHERDGVRSELSIGIAPDAAVKISLLRLTNRDGRRRRLRVTAYAEWTLGVVRDQAHDRVRTEADPASSAVLATNTFDPLFADWTAFCALSEPLTGVTADRREFLGRNGSASAPAGLWAPSLAGSMGSGYDPCAALQCAVELAPGASRDIVVLVGAARGDADARRLIAAYRDVNRAAAAVRASADQWAKRLSVLHVRTPEPSFDALVNRWLLYQTLASRMWARTGFYQSSGAYGFRDQLQDSMALVYAEPRLARDHILRAAGRQFEEGDVQHWWHEEDGRGIRTRFSDDLVWLPFVVDHYVGVTGDRGLLDAAVPYLRMRALEPHEQEVYAVPTAAGESGSVYEHCLRALRKACTRGDHGLPLIGSGDWNDGMNRVGIQGRGESVWLAWFLITTLRAFARLARARGDDGVAAECEEQVTAYQAAVEHHAWDGAWYRRAYFDDGQPLGAASDQECRIDSIAQSWSVISGAGAPERQRRAMQSVDEHLVRGDARVIELLTPPFDKTSRDPGYIKGYVPGVRENGAQYTHAATWVVLATALLGNGTRAFELYQMLNPLTRTRTPDDMATYEAEPYAVAADIYTAPGHVGRGGWTWYTGSSAWMYRVALETILGFTKRGDDLVIHPHAPDAWGELTIAYRFGASSYVITVQDPGRVGAENAAVTVDGTAVSPPVIHLVDDGRIHQVLVEPAGTSSRTGGTVSASPNGDRPGTPDAADGHTSAAGDHVYTSTIVDSRTPRG
ncbi:MAG TPA: hypothetical protein VMH39_11965, partial [Gemmatimonadaceae bacterium]|nr:hypothetical protein [Gemmatimonadaceae bacterium]